MVDLTVTDKNIKESYRQLKKARESMLSEFTANLTRWYACFASFRFWQFLLLNFFLGGPDGIVEEMTGISDSMSSVITKMVVTVVTGFFYDKFGYRKVLSVLIIV